MERLEAVVTCGDPTQVRVDHVVDIQGDMLTFGRPIATPVAGVTTIGTCAAPKTFAAAGLDALPMPLDGNSLVVWIKYGNGAGST